MELACNSQEMPSSAYAPTSSGETPNIDLEIAMGTFDLEVRESSHPLADKSMEILIKVGQGNIYLVGASGFGRATPAKNQELRRLLEASEGPASELEAKLGSVKVAYAQNVSRLITQLKEQEDAAMDKLANTYLNLQIAVMAGLFGRHPGQDFTWVKELLLNDADFAAMDDDEEEASNDTRGAQQ
ncbi:hypothetical protein GH714_004169 [Hevea brasiliensis]|uniref:Uncharacterized protein n=1 Tax=Hevea brasiliensis TaxID=3981 RepID=A0A6A6MWW7_HEVBR|nr:hypothetical protein GH714_004169 [Hevea brasiliensis]